MLRSALLAVALAAFGFGTSLPAAGEAGYWLWRAFAVACGIGAIAAIVWLFKAVRSPEDDLRFLEPDPTRNPATRQLRLWGFGILGLVGVAATAGAVAVHGVGGAVWWRVVLVCVAWPTLFAGAIGLTLTYREGRVATTPPHPRNSRR
jgi:hypothetical protein